MTRTLLRPMLAALGVVAIAAPRIAYGQPAPAGIAADASLPARGAIRVRAHTEWTRFDSFFGGDETGDEKTRPLGSLLSTAAFGARELPALAAADVALQALTGDPATRTSLGLMSATANTRIVRAPIGIDYGLTSRLSIGVTLPLVQTRSLLVAHLNAAGPGGNVGVNPRDVTTSTQVYDAFASAAANIEQALAQCGANPSDPVCTRQSEATALMQSTRAFAAAVQRVYGTTAGQGLPFVPLGADALFTSIQAHRQALSDQYASFFGAGIAAPDLPGGNVTVAMNELQAYLVEMGMGTRRDSLGIVERVGVGDVEISAAFQPVLGLVDSGPVPGAGARALLQVLVRLPTGLPPQYGLPFEVGTGGRFDVEGRAALDLRFARRVALSLSGQFTMPLAERKLPFVVGTSANPLAGGWPASGTWKPGPIAQAFVTPRISLTDFLRLDLHYAFIRRGSDRYTVDDPEPGDDLGNGFAPGATYDLPATIEHRAGGGFSYGAPTLRVRGRPLPPIEVGYAHLETFLGSGGMVPRMSVDQLHMKIYLQIFGRRGAPKAR